MGDGDSKEGGWLLSGTYVRVYIGFNEDFEGFRYGI